jgi:hypothetical protein
MHMHRRRDCNGRQARRSTATRGEYVTSEAILYGSISLLPAADRMILVRVYQGGDGAGPEVSWVPVVGLVAYQRTIYRKCVPSGEGRIPPGSHQELVEAGYRSIFPDLAIHPVYCDPYGFVEGGNRSMRHAGEVRRAVVPCDWPPEQDRENAVRIGKELMADTYTQEQWASLDDGEEAPSDPGR